MGRIRLDGRNFKIPSPPLAIFCVSLGPFCAPPKASCPPLKNLRAPLKFCPCAVCASCDRATLDRAKSLSLEFCSKFIVKFKITSPKLAPSPREIGICAVFCGANFRSCIRRTRDAMSLDDASKFKRLRHSKRAQRNKSRCKRHRTGSAAIRRNAGNGSVISATGAESGPSIAVLKFHGPLICNFKILRNVRS